MKLVWGTHGLVVSDLMRWLPVALVGVAQLPLVVITVMQCPAPWLLPVQV